MYLTGLDDSGGQTFPFPQASLLRPDGSSFFALILLRKLVLSELQEANDGTASVTSQCLLLLLPILAWLLLGFSNCKLCVGDFMVDTHEESKQNSCEQW